MKEREVNRLHLEIKKRIHSYPYFIFAMIYFLKQKIITQSLFSIIRYKCNIHSLTKKDKKDLIVKRITPVSKKKDEFYEVTKKAIDKFQTYLQKNQQFFQLLNNFSQKKTEKTQD